MDDLHQHIAAVAPRALDLLAALRERIARLDLPGSAIVVPALEEARYSLEGDPGNGGQTLRAAFFPTPHYCIGFLLFHPDGSSFAEYHVMRLHPARPELFIEAVEAWVRDGKIRTDLRLAAMPQ